MHRSHRSFLRRTPGDRARSRYLPMVTALVWAGSQVMAAQTGTSTDDFFRQMVQPILEQHCYECHSHAAKEAKGGLVLDSRGGWESGGDSGTPIVPGDPEASLLLSAVRYQDLEMPPGGRLSDQQVEVLRRWIADGAPDPRNPRHTRRPSAIDWQAGRKHWAFQALRSSSLPAVQDRQWSRNDVDQYVLHQLETRGAETDGRRGSVYLVASSEFRSDGVAPYNRADPFVCRGRFAAGSGKRSGPLAWFARIW